MTIEKRKVMLELLLTRVEDPRLGFMSRTISALLANNMPFFGMVLWTKEAELPRLMGVGRTTIRDILRVVRGQGLEPGDLIDQELKDEFVRSWPTKWYLMPDVPIDRLLIPLEELGMKPASIAALRRYRIFCLGQLIIERRYDLVRIPGLTKVCIQDAARAAREHGFELNSSLATRERRETFEAKARELFPDARLDSYGYR